MKTRKYLPETKKVKCSRCGQRRNTSSMAFFCHDKVKHKVCMEKRNNKWICVNGYGCSKEG